MLVYNALRNRGIAHQDTTFAAFILPHEPFPLLVSLPDEVYRRAAVKRHAERAFRFNVVRNRNLEKTEQRAFYVLNRRLRCNLRPVLNGVQRYFRANTTVLIGVVRLVLDGVHAAFQLVILQFGIIAVLFSLGIREYCCCDLTVTVNADRVRAADCVKVHKHTVLGNEWLVEETADRETLFNVNSHMRNHTAQAFV